MKLDTLADPGSFLATSSPWRCGGFEVQLACHNVLYETPIIPVQNGDFLIFPRDLELLIGTLNGWPYLIPTPTPGDGMRVSLEHPAWGCNRLSDHLQLEGRYVSLIIEALPGTHPILEDFKLKHRAVDVKQAQAHVGKVELENLRLAARLLSDDFEDPEVDGKIVVEGNTSVVVSPDADRNAGIVSASGSWAFLTELPTALPLRDGRLDASFFGGHGGTRQHQTRTADSGELKPLDPVMYCQPTAKSPGFPQFA